jgi:hypothetical protein
MIVCLLGLRAQTAGPRPCSARRGQPSERQEGDVMMTVEISRR